MMEVDYSAVSTNSGVAVKDADWKSRMWGAIQSRFRFDGPCHRRNFVQTVCVYLNFIMLGWNYGQLGTAFHDLQLVLGTDVKQTSLIFTMNSIGYMAGSMSIGVVYDRMDKLLLLGLVSIANAISSAVTPWCTSYGTFLGIRLLTGFLCGGLDSGGNAKVASCWGTGGSQYMQALHFSYAFGGIISPLVTSLFMAPRIEHDRSLSNMSDITNHTIASRNPWPIPTIYTSFGLNSTDLIVTDASVAPPPTDVRYGETHIHTAFVITGILSALIGSGYIVLYRIGYENVGPYYSNVSMGRNDSKPNGRLPELHSNPKLGKAKTTFVLCFLALSVVLFSAVECKFQSFLMPFILKQMQWTKQACAYIISLLWAFYAIGRFLGIPISGSLTPCTVLVIYMSSTLALSIVMFFGAFWQIHWLIWITVPLSGWSISVIFPSFIVWTGDHVTKITGKMAGYFLCVGAVGYLIDPLYIGMLMENLSPLYFVYLQIGEISASFLIYVLLVFWVRKQK